jgi:hypothetical protein
MSKKIGVRKAMQPQIDSSGKLSYVMNVGGKQSGGNRGPTKREKVGGALGGAVGVLGALTGSHRSLGGLAASMYAGQTQGSMFGRGLAGSTVSDTRRARAKLDEGKRQEDAQLAAQRQKRMGRVEAGGSYNPMRVGANLKDDESRLDDVGSGGRNPNFGGFRSGKRAKFMADRERADLQAQAQAQAQAQLEAKEAQKIGLQLARTHPALVQQLQGNPRMTTQLNEFVNASGASERVNAASGFNALGPNKSPTLGSTIAPLSPETNKQIAQGDQPLLPQGVSDHEMGIHQDGGTEVAPENVNQLFATMNQGQDTAAELSQMMNPSQGS